MMTKTEVLALMALLEAAYPNYRLHTTSVEIYAQYLQDLDFKLAEKAIHNLIRNEDWFPTIAQIRQAAAETVHDVPSTEQAMATLREAVRTGNYTMVKKNPLLEQAVDTVGWPRLKFSENPEPLNRDVRNAYERLRAREMQRLIDLPRVGQAALTYTEEKEA